MRPWEPWVQKAYEAAKSLGFEPRQVDFVEVSADAVYQIAAYGYPGRYTHWSFGRSYYFQRQSFEAGMGKIYELVTNTRPAVAYLMDRNTLADQIFVICHVLGHALYFDWNAGMRAVRPDLLAVLQSSKARFREYEAEFGRHMVESLLETAHALMLYVDPLADQRPKPTPPPDPEPTILGDLLPAWEREDERLYSYSRYRDRLADYARGLPQGDLLYFFMEKAPLEPWERDVLQVVREIGLALHPQVRTKMADEGLACWAGMKILHALDLPDDMHWHQSSVHARVTHPDPLNLNPYWIGWRLWTYLEGCGHNVKDLCEFETDASLLRNWVDEGFVAQEKLYEWDSEIRVGLGNPQRLTFKTKTRDWERVRDALVAHVPFPLPVSVIARDVYSNGTLALDSETRLDEKDTGHLLQRIANRIWKRPVEIWSGDWHLSSDIKSEATKG